MHIYKSENISAHIKGNLAYLYYEIKVKHEMTLKFYEKAAKKERNVFGKNFKIIDTLESVSSGDDGEGDFDQQITTQIR